MISITAQLFATPSSAVLSKRSKRTQPAMTAHQVGHMGPASYPGLSEDLLSHWDNTYLANRFSPASKFLGDIDKSKNRHILQH